MKNQLVATMVSAATLLTPLSANAVTTILQPTSVTSSANELEFTVISSLPNFI